MPSVDASAVLLDASAVLLDASAVLLHTCSKETNLKEILKHLEFHKAFVFGSHLNLRPSAIGTSILNPP